MHLASTYEFAEDITAYVACASEKYFVLSTEDGNVHVLDTGGGLLRTVKVQEKPGVWAVALLDESVVTGADDGHVRMWDIESGAKLQTFAALPSVTTALVTSTSPERPFVVAGDYDGNIGVFCARSGATLQLLNGHTDKVTKLALVSSSRCVSTSYDRTVRVWDLAAGACLHALRGHAKEIFCLQLDSARRRVITASLDGAVWVWDVDNGQHLATMPGHAPRPTSYIGLYNSDLPLESSEEKLVTTGVDGRVRLWSLTTYKQVCAVRAHKKAALGLEVLGDTVITGGKEGGERKDVCGLFTRAVATTFAGHGSKDNSRGGSGDAACDATDGKAEAAVSQLGGLAVAKYTVTKVGNMVALAACKRGKLVVEFWKQDEVLPQ